MGAHLLAQPAHGALAAQGKAAERVGVRQLLGAEKAERGPDPKRVARVLVLANKGTSQSAARTVREGTVGVGHA